MTLGELVEKIEDLDDSFTIYAEGGPNWNKDSKAVAVYEPDDGSLPPEAKGMRYFLEVSIAKDVINVWKQWRNGKNPSTIDKLKAIIHYAKNDAYLPL
jgi:hypothetical protein